MTKLTDLDGILLSNAAQRDTGSVFPAPDNLSGTPARLTKAVASLLKRGFAEERETTDTFAVQTLKSAAAKGSVKAAQILLDSYVTVIRRVADQEPGPEVDTWEQEAIDQLLAELDLPKRPVIRQTNRKDSK
ncbi:hypothetical protein [Sphingomonas sp. PB4P5]|uniref:hypothetical protein n=1 Tax=Parasphingomonas puruogangriensis TaxID=3096155 RepID=UPI002FCC4022